MKQKEILIIAGAVALAFIFLKPGGGPTPKPDGYFPLVEPSTGDGKSDLISGFFTAAFGQNTGIVPPMYNQS